MSEKIGPLNFEALLQDSQFINAIKRMVNETKAGTNKITKETEQLDKVFKNLALGIAGYFSVSFGKELITQIVRVRGEFQQLEIAFTTMLKSKSKADKLMSDLVRFAGTTPFGLKDAASAAKQLLAYGSSAENVTNELRMLGDVAAGISAPLGDIVYLYGTLRTQGRAYTQDIKQFAARGIPVYEELAKVLRTTSDQVTTFVENGKVGFAEVEQMFKNMTAEGSLFGGLMEKQSVSVLGQFERLKDALDVMYNEIGQKNEGLINGSIASVATLIENYETILDILKVVIATYGTYKAALFLTAAAEKALMVAGNVRAWFELAKGIKTAKDAQIAFSLATTASPLGVMAGILGALAAAYFVFSDSVSEADKHLEKYRERLDEIINKKNDLKNTTNSLIGVINDENQTEFAKQRAYNQLLKMYPEILGQMKLHEFQALSTAEAQKKFNSELDTFETTRLRQEYAKLQEEIAKLEKQITDLIQTPTDNPTALSGMIKGLQSRLDAANKALDETKAKIDEIDKAEFDSRPNSFKLNYYNEVLDKLKKQREEIENSIKNTEELNVGFWSFKTIIDEITLETLNKQITDIVNKIKGINESEIVTIFNKAYWEKQKKDAEEALAAMSEFEKGSAKWIEQLEKLRLAEKKLELWNFSNKSKDDTGPYGSIKYWENVAKKAQEAFDKSVDPEEMKRLQSVILNAQEQAEILRKKYAIRSFEEEIEYKREQYELYWQFVENLGKEAADIQFSELISQGETFRKHLENQINELKKLDNRTPRQNEQLNFLQNTLNVENNKRSAIDLWKEQADRQKEILDDLYKYQEWLHQESENAKTDITRDGEEKRLEIFERLRKVQQEIEDKERIDYAGYVKDFASFEDKKTEILKKYQKIREQAQKKGDVSLISGIDQAETDELNDLYNQFFEKSNAFVELNKQMLITTRKSLDEKLNLIKRTLDWALQLFGEDSEVYKYLKELYAKTELESAAFDENRVRMWAEVLSQASEVLQNMNGSLSELGAFMGGIVSQTNNLITAFSKLSTDEEKVAAGISAAFSMVNMVVSASQQRKKAEEEYYTSVLAQQREYNNLLNEQIRLSAELDENVFLKDYEGRITSGLKAFRDAQESYTNSLKKLKDAQVKIGQRDAISWANVGSGAAAGAVLGTIVPGVGNAVGAVVGGIVGAIVGLFGGKKKQDVFGNLLQEYPELIQTAADGSQKLNIELLKSIKNQGFLNKESEEWVQAILDANDAMEKAREQIKGVISELAGSLGNDLRTALVDAFQTGEDAARAFADSVERVMEDVLSQMIFNSIFDDAFDKLQKRMESSYDFGGDGNWLDDFGEFFKDAGGLWEEFYAGLQAAQNAAKQYGLDLWDQKDTQNLKGMSGAIKGVTEQTAGVIEGQMNAIRINQVEAGNNLRQILFNIVEIAFNTRYLIHINDSLISIEQKTKMQYDSLKSKGIL